ncbi:hypothetical protein SKAU_G00224100 [Synaphobranchus kaupii]|uniref:VWFA domain-containing protein n=1 Tax=Synaphobranchus kaupii TaxID=118154 RepID=A0A9Q1IWC3_SYNKA|nr:hypothetical protein SKAU_G00224100 [Synaphobranchus kaupii]
MEFRGFLFLLKSMVLLKGLCQCFNIDVKRPRIFTGPEDALFGFSVLQHEIEGEKLMLVGAPWDGPANNRKGDIYKCTVAEERSSNCTKVNLGEIAFQNVSRNLKNSHLGMTLSPDTPDGFLACAPLWSQECGTSVFSTGICTSVSDDLEPRETIAPTAQRCSTFMDIVIVLDGSNSIYPWYEVQNFLSNILSKFHISPEQMQVGVLQYGEVSVHEWSLRDYQTTQEVVEAAKNISRQEGRETRTAYAIHMGWTGDCEPSRGPYVAQHCFITQKAEVSRATESRECCFAEVCHSQLFLVAGARLRLQLLPPVLMSDVTSTDVVPRFGHAFPHSHCWLTIGSSLFVCSTGRRVDTPPCRMPRLARRGDVNRRGLIAARAERRKGSALTEEDERVAGKYHLRPAPAHRRRFTLSRRLNSPRPWKLLL